MNVCSDFRGGKAGPREIVASHVPTSAFAPCAPPSPDEAEIAPAAIMAATASSASAPTIDFLLMFLPFRHNLEVVSSSCAASVAGVG